MLIRNPPTPPIQTVIFNFSFLEQVNIFFSPHEEGTVPGPYTPDTLFYKLLPPPPPFNNSSNGPPPAFSAIRYWYNFSSLEQASISFYEKEVRSCTYSTPIACTLHYLTNFSFSFSYISHLSFLFFLLSYRSVPISD